MNLKSIYRTFFEIRYFKLLIKKYGQSLLPGRYMLYPSMRAIALDSASVLDSANKYFDIKTSPSKTTALISGINKTSYYKNSNKSQGEKYEAIYSANNIDAVREIKLFSFSRNEILTVCTGKEAYDKQFDEYNSFKDYFAMPIRSQ